MPPADGAGEEELIASLGSVRGLRNDRDLASVRDPSATVGLSDAEFGAWRRFWDKVEKEYQRLKTAVAASTPTSQAAP